MPSASSPYSPNDYQASKYRGYDLPINSIFKGLAAQDQFWKIGALRVKQVYDNALNLKLSKEPNQQIRKQFMQDADKQLTELSSMNLGDPSVQRQGFGIFKPLMEDEGIVSDDAATRYIDSLNLDINNAREKENGKYYHPNNAMYALDGVKEFKDSKDRMAGKTYLSKAREYEPYYDFSGEMNTILKNCKPEEYSRDVETGMNIFTYSSKALSSVRLSGCIDAGLSPKAKRQLSIDGYVTYKNNPGALRDAYLPLIDNTRAQLEEENASYSGILSNKDNLKNLTDAQLKKIGLDKESIKQITPELLKSFDVRTKNNQLRLHNLNETISKLQSGDFSPIMGDNLEPIASMVYSKGYADNYGAAFSYNPPPSVKIGSNAAQMLIYKENKADIRQEDQQEFEKGMKEMDIEAGRQLQLLKNMKVRGSGPNGEITAEDIANRGRINPAFTQDVSKIGSYDKITQEGNKIDTSMSDLDRKMLPRLRAMGMDPSIVSDEQFFKHDNVYLSWYNSKTKTLPIDDPDWGDIQQYEQMKGDLLMTKQIIKNNQEQIDKIALSEIGSNPATPYLNELSKKPGANFTNEFNINNIGFKKAIDIINDINTGNASLSVDSAPLGEYRLYYKDGRKAEVSKVSGGGTLKNILKDVDSYFHKSHEYDNKLSAKRNSIASTKTIVQKEGYSFPDINDPKSELKLSIIDSVGLGRDMINAVTLGDTDLRGNVEVFIRPETGGSPKYDESGILEQFRNKYGDNFHTIPGENKYHFVLGGFRELDKFTSPEFGWAEKIAPYIRVLQSKVTDLQPQRTGLVRSPTDPSKQYGLEVSNSLSGNYKYRIYDDQNKTMQSFTDINTALSYFNRTLQQNDAQKRLINAR